MRDDISADSVESITETGQIIVHVYPGIKESHISQIYTGLYDLDNQGKIKVHFQPLLSREQLLMKPHTLWLEAKDKTTDRKRKICFDMADGSAIASPEALKEADCYFKRSYASEEVKKLPVNLRDKVFPYGLNYACRSSYEKMNWQRLLATTKPWQIWRNNPLSRLKELLAYPLKQQLAKCRLPCDLDLPVLSPDFEVPPSQETEGKILFQARAWSPAECPGIPEEKLKKLNKMRAMTVKVLREEFGDRFIGGLAPTEYAKAHYPGYLATMKTDKNSYMALVRKCLICVTTKGLHNSTGWKLPEYIAASRCIISEPLMYDLPNPLEEGKNYFVFRSPEECVTICRTILASPELVYRMRQSNWHYYNQEIKPSALIGQCLSRAFHN